MTPQPNTQATSQSDRMPSDGLKPLHPHQQVALDLLKASIAGGHRRPLVCSPTGSGKTVLSAHIVAGARRKHKLVTFCVPALTLIDQTFERFVENGIDPAEMGIIQASHPYRRPKAPVQIATAQTLARRDFPECDVVVIDECHVRHAVYEKWIARPNPPLFIGLSATPWSKGLGKVFDDLIRPTSIGELIEGGYLSPFRVFAPSHPDLDGISTVAGDYHEGELGERMSKATIVADIVSTWLAKADNRPTLCFCVNRPHAALVHEQFVKAGVPAAYVDAMTPREERAEIGRKLASGEVKVVCNIGVLTTGIDWDVRCLILARPTKSEMLFTQIVGRALRTAEGKDHALILDHSDTHLRLGMVTDIDHDELDDGKPRPGSAKRAMKQRGVPLPRECQSCACLVPAAMKFCPSCGAVSRKPHNVEVVGGELSELRAGGQRSKPMTATDQVKAMPREDVYYQLEAIRQERGRSYGWLANTYREWFGVWPRGFNELLPPRQPTNAVRAAVRAKDIRFARSHKAQGAAHV